ncbi:hypothetical protein ACLOJK_014742 [Asimina triloba]
MAPRRVACVVPNLETEGEQSMLPQHEEGSSLPPQDSPDNVIADTPDLPLVGPAGYARRPPAIAFPLTIAPIAHAYRDTPSPMPPIVPIPEPLAPQGKKQSIPLTPDSLISRCDSQGPPEARSSHYPCPNHCRTAHASAQWAWPALRDYEACSNLWGGRVHRKPPMILPAYSNHGREESQWITPSIP